jgi:hypothetical protein
VKQTDIENKTLVANVGLGIEKKWLAAGKSI